MKRTTPAVCLAALPAALAGAQEAMYTAAATMPSPGALVLREQIHAWRFGSNPESGSDSSTQYDAMTSVALGLARGWAVTVDVPVALRTDEYPPPRGDDHDLGVEDLDVMFKYRFYKDDTGGVNTLRAALLGGAAIASGDDHDFSSTSVNPMLGAVVTLVRGRHGFNQDLIVKWNTGGDADSNSGGDGPSDAVRVNSAYVYRVFPERYTEQTEGSWYVTAEINTIYETNSDWEVRWSPGLMYEGRRWGFELMGQLPLYQNVDHRAELDWGIGVGVRLLF